MFWSSSRRNHGRHSQDRRLGIAQYALFGDSANLTDQQTGSLACGSLPGRDVDGQRAELFRGRISPCGNFGSFHPDDCLQWRQQWLTGSHLCDSCLSTRRGSLERLVKGVLARVLLRPDARASLGGDRCAARHPLGEPLRHVWRPLDVNSWNIGTSLLGVVLWGTLSGSMLPFIMQ